MNIEYKIRLLQGRQMADGLGERLQTREALAIVRFDGWKELSDDMQQSVLAKLSPIDLARDSRDLVALAAKILDTELLPRVCAATMHFTLPEDFLWFAVSRGMRTLGPIPHRDKLALRATCRATRDLVDDSQFWPCTATKYLGDIALSLPPPAARDVALALGRRSAAENLQQSLQKSAESVGIAVQSAAMSGLMTLQYTVFLPYLILSAPVMGVGLGTVLGAGELAAAIAFAVERLPNRPVAQAAVLTCAPGAFPATVVGGILVGSTCLMPGTLAASMLLGGAAALSLAHAAGSLVSAGPDPGIRALLSEKITVPSLRCLGGREGAAEA